MAGRYRLSSGPAWLARTISWCTFVVLCRSRNSYARDPASGSGATVPTYEPLRSRCVTFDLHQVS
jgi:hypothetical protein